MIKFLYYGKPKSKERPRFNKYTGVTYTPKNTFNFENDFRKQFVLQNKGLIPSEKPLRVLIRFYFETKYKYGTKNYWKTYGNYYIGNKDLDNMAKSVLDSLNKIAYKDDRQVVELAVGKYYAETDKIEIEISEVEND